MNGHEPAMVSASESFDSRAASGAWSERDDAAPASRTVARSSLERPCLIGDSAPMQRLRNEIELVASTDATVLLYGETGTGKELVAESLRDASRRSAAPFVKVNCAALPAGTLESELFGHERGAFTGAHGRHIGRFERAHGGTLFLDEVGELPLEVQPKLLRLIQEGELERVGGTHTVHSDVRIIAATHRDLAAMVASGAFREDLYYRLEVFPIQVPPLRERRGDIAQLVHHFMHRFASRLGKRLASVDATSLARLCEHEWPGNVRELQNALERAVILCSGPVLTVELRATTTARRALGSTPAPPADHAADTLDDAQRRHILGALAATGWVVDGARGAAARLGMKRSTLKYRMQKLGIVRAPA